MNLTGIHEGEDGWLFLVGGTNRPASFYRRDLRSWNLLRRWRKLIEARRARCRAAGIAYLHTVVPEKLSIYDDRTGTLRIDAELGLAARLAAKMARSDARGSYLDLVAPMRAVRGDADLYHRTDTHWNFAGCHLAYREICHALGAAVASDLAQRPHAWSETLGDLGIKLDPPRRERMQEHVFLQHGTRIDENALSRAMWEGTLHHPRFVGARSSFANGSPEADPRRVVLFGDSYSQTLANRLTGMLAETFRELHFVWSTSLDWSYVEHLKPDILIAEHAERFLVRVPDDRFDAAATP